MKLEGWGLMSECDANLFFDESIFFFFFFSFSYTYLSISSLHLAIRDEIWVSNVDGGYALHILGFFSLFFSSICVDLGFQVHLLFVPADRIARIQAFPRGKRVCI